ncbi:MAG TPA: hypothetical protein PLG59_06780 [bacterium]|nr:hypothetical protein [bacterium]HQO34347.1 hypothetical protein [bacterium]HQP97896.1 hypothetical protein [bacterium]
MNETPLLGQIIRILDDHRLVANRGSADGWAKGDLLVVFEEGDEILDPQTGQSLGKLELVKAEMEAVHVQEHMSILMARLPHLAEQPHTVMSALLTHAPSGGTLPGVLPTERGPLPIQRDQISGRPSVNPISIGDSVRKI